MLFNAIPELRKNDSFTFTWNKIIEAKERTHCGVDYKLAIAKYDDVMSIGYTQRNYVFENDGTSRNSSVQFISFCDDMKRLEKWEKYLSENLTEFLKDAREALLNKLQKDSEEEKKQKRELMELSCKSNSIIDRLFR